MSFCPCDVGDPQYCLIHRQWPPGDEWERLSRIMCAPNPFLLRRNRFRGRRMRKQLECVMCGRVGTRVFMRSPKGTVCRNRAACVMRLCDKAFADKPEPRLGDAWVRVATKMDTMVRFYGVLHDDPTPDTVQATLEII